MSYQICLLAASVAVSPATGNLITAPGIIITLILLFIPILVMVILLLVKAKRLFSMLRDVKQLSNAKRDDLISADGTLDGNMREDAI